MKIYLITSDPTISDKLRGELEKCGDLTFFNAQKMPISEVHAKAADAEILVVGPSGIADITREMLEGLKKLKLIATLSVGVAWIDTVAAKELGITICNIKGANAESVAEHAWGMILDLGKRISEFARDAKEKGAFRFADYTGKEVYKKTIGIIGLGDIGQRVARIAHGFDMRIIGVNKSGKAVEGIELVNLDTLLSESDVIVLCVPLTPETENMISYDEIAKMKNGVILVNPAIEVLTNKDAVLKGLKSGKIFGFGIETDVLKPIPADSLLYKHPRIVATPHNAFNSEDANMNSYTLVVENVKAFIAGKPQNVVV